MKLRSACSLFVCAALAMTLAGCGSSDDSATSAEAAPGPAEVVRMVLDAIVSGDRATFLKNTTASFPMTKEEFKEATEEADEHDMRFHVGQVRMDGDIARVRVSVSISGRKGPKEGELEATVRKLNGVWKVDDIGKVKGSYDTTDDIMDDANTSATRTTISAIESAAQTWETRHFKKPDSLDRLLEPDGDREPLLPAKARTDAWGNEIQYRLNGRRMEIRSAGPDGRMNTSDDVTN